MDRQRSIGKMRVALSAEATGLSRVRHVTMFEARRGEKLVTIKVVDRGGDSDPLPRFYCRAETEDGRVAVGNGGPTPEWAIEETHWDDLDEPPVDSD